MKLTLTKSNIDQVIKWSSSPYNEYTKDEVVVLAYKILLSGRGRQFFSSGSYTPKTKMNNYRDYLVNGGEGVIHEVEGKGEALKVIKTYEFEPIARQFSAPESFKWKTKKLGSGNTVMNLDWLTYHVHVCDNKRSEEPPYWVIDNYPVDHIADGTEDTLEEA